MGFRSGQSRDHGELARIISIEMRVFIQCIIVFSNAQARLPLVGLGHPRLPALPPEGDVHRASPPY